jgi:hypothetical protein
MNIKNSLIAIVLLMTYLVISCCKDPDEKYSRINDINISLYKDKSNRYPIEEIDTVTSDTLTMVVDFDYQFIVNTRIDFNVIQRSYAISCPKPGEYGLKSKIKSITLSSNKTYRDKSPNSSLNELVTCGIYYNVYFEPYSTLNDLKDSLNNRKYYFLEYPAIIFVNSKPENDSLFKYRFDIEFEDGNNISKETVNLVWN